MTDTVIISAVMNHVIAMLTTPANISSIVTVNANLLGLQILAINFVVNYQRILTIKIIFKD